MPLFIAIASRELGASDWHQWVTPRPVTNQSKSAAGLFARGCSVARTRAHTHTHTHTRANTHACVATRLQTLSCTCTRIDRQARGLQCRMESYVGVGFAPRQVSTGGGWRGPGGSPLAGNGPWGATLALLLPAPLIIISTTPDVTRLLYHYYDFYYYYGS